MDDFNTYLISCSNDMKVVCLNSFEIVNSFAPHISWTNSCSWNCDNTLVASTGSAESVKIHSDPINNDNSYEIGSTKVKLELAAFSHNSQNLLATCGGDKMVILWDAVSNCPVQAFEPLKTSPICLSFTCNDKYLCVGCQSKQTPSSVISIFDIARVANNKAIKVLSLPSASQKEDLVKIDTSKFSNHLFACSTSEGNLYGVDIETSKTIHFNPTSEIESKVVDMAFSHVNNLLMMGAHENGKISFYDINEEKVINTIDTREILTCIEQTKDGKKLVVGTKNGKILFYDMRHMSEPLKVLKAHPGAVRSICINNRIERPQKLESDHQEKISEDFSLNLNLGLSNSNSSDYHFSFGRTSMCSHSNATVHSDKSLNFYKHYKYVDKKQQKLPMKDFTPVVSPGGVKVKLNQLSDNSLSDSGRNNSDSYKTCPTTTVQPYLSDMDTLFDNDVNCSDTQKNNFMIYLEKSIQNTITKTLSNSLTNSLDLIREDIHKDLRNLHIDIISYLTKLKISQDKMDSLNELIHKLKKQNKYLKGQLNKYKSQE